MAEVKLTKNALRAEQLKLNQLRKYLPTLQLKKAMLQSEVAEARSAILALSERYLELHHQSHEWCALLTVRTSVDPMTVVRIRTIHKRYENIAGVEVPTCEGVDFEPIAYNLFETPEWVDGVIIGLRELQEARIRVDVAEEKKMLLEKELREVSIRVNLFEKILIPRSLKNIRRIRVFLGDMQLAAVSQAKVAKAKIEANKREALAHAV